MRNHVPTWLWWAAGGAGLAWLLYANRQQAAATVEDAAATVDSGIDAVTAAIAGWKQVKQGPTWVPVLNSVETQLGIPPDLLARMAYQESHFRPEFIDGSKASSAGALGIMQLMPQWFASVDVPRPFSSADTVQQIWEAGRELVRLMDHFNDWGLAVAAYNDGQGNIDAYTRGTHTLPAQTVDYVSEILADVPLSGASIPA